MYYLCQSRRPLVSLAFIAPLLLAYEVGILCDGVSMRNGADVWLRRLLDTFGFSGYFLLPFLTIAMLIAWHHTTRQPWKFSSGLLGGMLIESSLFGLALVGVARLHGTMLASMGNSSWGSCFFPFGQSAWNQASQIVAFLGAGVYEEVLFRLLLIPLAIWLIRIAGGSPRGQVAGAIVATSLLFALAHYVGTYGDPLEWATFIFRFSAGLFFAGLFVWRGFGIAAGAHALYDIFVGVTL
ncbi:MAG: CPBP family intramembrane metalloprotease [Pirellulales bacterium]|nr:CPBP family intramembrane metalloprotease [Pirellulales bacterium]